ncbi:hypothetical protein IP90_00965 [Luteimonas cucumeris]|uniref:Uncharacterized protein n=1 Tax=Luteimonas cucumeris TaxID=985012 RepID=A0A562LAY9_9GAMM|nr:hypothetical protein [Luteimonas cucumeris]TWI04827.1 hypothetical protein IP90_00965 [Luteimonas cucumeris]
MKFWTAEEDVILRANYESVGAIGLLSSLPDRGASAIMQRACRLGLVSGVNRMNAKCEELYPRDGNERRCDMALRHWGAAEPANGGLFWRVA